MPTELTLTLPHLKLAALAWGPADGVPVLGLHGWLDNAATFTALAPLLDGIRLVALDLPGHGHSDWRPAGAAYHFIDWVPDVAAAADALGWDRFSLLGHSMGAGISTLVAGALGERIARLVLIEGLGPMSTEAAEAPAQVARALAHRRRAAEGQRRVYASLDEAVERRSTATSPMARSSAEVLVARNLRQVEGGWAFGYDPALRGTSILRLTEAHVQAFIGAITAPTLLIGASEGWPFDPELLAARVARLRDGRVMTVPGGHHVHLDDAGVLGEAVAGWLRG